MRRNKKYNIHTNRTIKKNHTYRYCTTCKSVCKAPYLESIDPNTFSDKHMEQAHTRKKLHQIGVGSLHPGQTFIPIVNWTHYPSLRKNEQFKRRRSIEKVLNFDVEWAEFTRRADLLAACS